MLFLCLSANDSNQSAVASVKSTARRCRCLTASSSSSLPKVSVERLYKRICIFIQLAAEVSGLTAAKSAMTIDGDRTAADCDREDDDDVGDWTIIESTGQMMAILAAMAASQRSPTVTIDETINDDGDTLTEVSSAIGVGWVVELTSGTGSDEFGFDDVGISS
jgi:hypothetical protein